MISLDALEALARRAKPWANEVFKDSCAQCDKEGTSEWHVVDIDGGYHAMFGDESQARFIAACDPQTILELIERARGR